MKNEKNKQIVYDIMNNLKHKNFNIMDKLDEIEKPFYGYLFVFDLG